MGTAVTADRVVQTASIVVVALVIATPAMAPPAHALTPPVVDNSLLPAAAAPVPPRPTVQVDPCTVPTGSTRDTTAGGLDRLGLEEVWRLSRGDGQLVAVIDTGVTPHHRLARVTPGGDYVSTGDGTQDCDGHGTMVAGIIAATPDLDDTISFSGIAPAADILSIRQSSTKFGPADDPSHDGVGDVVSMAMAVRTAADLGATVINISSIACAAGALDDGALGAALAYAVDTKDAVVVAAAGNAGGAGRCPRQAVDAELTWENTTVVASPAWYDDYVLTVGSVGPDDAPSDFSLPGPWVDVAAPGEQVVSLNPAGSGLVDELPVFGRPMPISGTSYAAPVVSGVAALLRARFPELTARQVMARIETTARSTAQGWNPVTGNGIVDPVAALSSQGAPRPVPPHSPPPVPDTADVPTTAARPPADDPAATTALIGAGVCAALLAGAVLIAGLRRSGGRSGERSGQDRVVGGQGG